MRNWELSIGLYPGILFGLRTYYSNVSDMWVLYVPFIELCLEVFNEEYEEDE